MARIGELDQMVTFQEAQTAPDGHGGQTVSWVDVASAWAKVEPVRASESETRGGVRAVAAYLFEMHRRADLTEAMRIVWDGREYNIREIRIGAPREITMTVVAERGVAQ